MVGNQQSAEQCQALCRAWQALMRMDMHGPGDHLIPEQARFNKGMPYWGCPGGQGVGDRTVSYRPHTVSYRPHTVSYCPHTVSYRPRSRTIPDAIPFGTIPVPHWTKCRPVSVTVLVSVTCTSTVPVTMLYRPSPTPYRIPYRHRPRRSNMHMCTVPVTCIRRDLLLAALLITLIPLRCMLYRYQHTV